MNNEAQILKDMRNVIKCCHDISEIYPLNEAESPSAYVEDFLINEKPGTDEYNLSRAQVRGAMMFQLGINGNTQLISNQALTDFELLCLFLGAAKIGRMDEVFAKFNNQDDLAEYLLLIDRLFPEHQESNYKAIKEFIYSNVDQDDLFGIGDPHRTSPSYLEDIKISGNEMSTKEVVYENVKALGMKLLLTATLIALVTTIVLLIAATPGLNVLAATCGVAALVSLATVLIGHRLYNRQPAKPINRTDYVIRPEALGTTTPLSRLMQTPTRIAAETSSKLRAAAAKRYQYVTSHAPATFFAPRRSASHLQTREQTLDSHQISSKSAQ